MKAKDLPRYFTPKGSSGYIAKARKLEDGRVVVTYLGRSIVLGPDATVLVEDNT